MQQKCMDVKMTIISEVIYTRKDRYDIPFINGILKKNDTDEFIYKTNRLTDIEDTLMFTKGDSSRRGHKLGIWD